MSFRSVELDTVVVSNLLIAFHRLAENILKIASKVRNVPMKSGLFVILDVKNSLRNETGVESVVCYFVSGISLWNS